jgi:hypothetical protein
MVADGGRTEQAVVTTAEMRWFFPDRVPDPGGFLRYADWGAPEQRIDAYLSMAPSQAVGVKFRKGRFEIKASVGQAELVELSPLAAGVFERWRKWSVAGTPLEAFAAGLAADADLVTVEKRRWLLTRSLDGDPAMGLAAEVTALRHRGQDWWSFGFEAFGAERLQRQDFVAAAASFLQRHELATPLRLEASYSYPAWLSQLGT